MIMHFFCTLFVLESMLPVFVVSATFKEKKASWSILTEHFSLYIYSEKNKRMKVYKGLF